MNTEGYQVFLPLVRKSTTGKNRQHITSDIPLIPGYLFGKLTYEEFNIVENAKNVFGILREHGHRIIVPNEEIELLVKLQEKGIAYQVENLASNKSNYTVEKGDFQGVKGLSENGKLYVWLRRIGLQVSMELDDLN